MPTRITTTARTENKGAFFMTLEELKRRNLKAIQYIYRKMFSWNIQAKRKDKRKRVKHAKRND